MFEILTIVGARPQIIKAAAISRALNSYREVLHETILHTGQHYDANMSAVFFEELSIPPAQINLGVGSGPHGKQTASMIEGIEQVLLELKPDLVLIYGDTNSTLAAAVAASKLQIPVAHVEAGLRSFNKEMPEEINRILADHCSSLLFCPTQTAVDNLIREGFNPNSPGPYSAENPRVMLSGDVMYDNTLFFGLKAEHSSDILQTLGLQKSSYHLATIHRDSNTDRSEKLMSILQGLGEIAERSGLAVVFPMHPRTLKMLGKKALDALTRDYPGIRIVEPLSFLDMSMLEKHCAMVFTDSGGVQKEAFFHGKPVVVLREETEWVEIISCGAGILAGSSEKRIVEAYHTLASAQNMNFPAVFGDGNASLNTIETILEFLGAAKA